MPVFSPSRVFLLSIILLTGCRSEKVAFQFRPAAPAVAVTRPATAETPAAAPLSEPATAEPAKVPAAPPVPPSQPQASRAVAVHRAKPTRPLLRRARAETQSIRAWQQASKPRRATDNEADVLHVVLGSLLIIGGVILGLLLDGWLGLGVGVAVVLLGYYFLVKGFGGPHAWLEIFQEFFNM